MQKLAASSARLRIPKSRSGRRPISVENFLKKEKDGTLFKDKLAQTKPGDVPTREPAVGVPREVNRNEFSATALASNFPSSNSKIAQTCLDELVWLGAVTPIQRIKLAETVSPEDAQYALHRLHTLEQNKATPSQLGRYAAVGATAGPLIGLTGSLIKGDSYGSTQNLRGLAKAVRIGRTAASDSARGAIASGLIPVVRSKGDASSERKKLVNYVREYGEGNTSKTGSALNKIGPLARKAWREGMQHELAPALASVAGAGIAGATDVNPLAGAAGGYGLGAVGELAVRAALKKRASEDKPKSTAAKAWGGARGEVGPAIGMIAGAGLGPILGKSPLTGAAIGYGLGGIPEIIHSIKNRGKPSAALNPKVAAAMAQQLGKLMQVKPGMALAKPGMMRAAKPGMASLKPGLQTIAPEI